MRSRKAATLGAVAICSVAVAACGSSSNNGGSNNASASASSGGGGTSSSGGPISIDVGSRKISFGAGTKPKIAVFAASGNAYQSAYIAQVPALQKKYNASITYFDSKFDVNTQLQQLRTALTDKKFNAWVVEPDGEVECSILSKLAPAAGIVVVQLTNPSCPNTEVQPAGNASWSSGTLTTVAGETNLTYYTAWLKKAMKMLGANAGPTGVINGPPLVAATRKADIALKAAGFDVVANVNSDYTTPKALQQTHAMLEAHPNLKAIVSVYSDSTLGVVKALHAAGQAGKIKVISIGATKTEMPLVKNGDILMTVPYSPITEIDTAVASIRRAFDGQQVPRFQAALAQGSPTSPYVVTKANVDSFTPQY